MAELNSPSIKIGQRVIGESFPPYIIAEMSGNHSGELDRALALVRAAKDAGADAVKLQTYTADTMTIDHDADDFRIRGGLWDGRNLYELYQQAHTPWAWTRPLFELGNELDINVFSTPFDETAVAFLEQFSPPAYKIASFELTDTPLLESVAKTGRPVILSTGMADVEEIATAVKTLEHSGAAALVILHCVSGYPTPVDESNIRTILDLSDRFGHVVGLSDHTLGTAVAVGAVACGARVIEKHLTLKRSDGGPDAAFSLEPDELKALVDDARAVFTALGAPGYARKPSEQANAQFRRSVYVVKDIAAGDVFDTENIRRIRPGFGLAPRLYPEILGKKAKRSLKRGSPLRAEDVGDG